MNRSSWKGVFINSSLLRVKKRIYSRRSVIYPKYINKVVYIHNGKEFIRVKITGDMIGHKFGEFALTRKLYTFKGKKGAANKK